MRRKERIENELSKAFSPTALIVEDESVHHHVPQDAQTHFKVTMAAKGFTGLSLIKRHQLLNKLLRNEFDTGMHALSMHLYSPEEWEMKKDDAPKSPPCKDGYKNN